MSQSEWLKGGIFDAPPSSWRELQDYVAQLFRELGYRDVQTPYKLQGLRTTKEIDVHAVDPSAVPPIRIACECKYWSSKVPQAVVLEFLSVLEDSGVNRGFIVSKIGFQSPGAYDAARNTAIVLVDFEELMQLFFDPWLIAMSVRLEKASAMLFPFFDIYGFETLPKLPQDKLKLFADLRHKYHVAFSLGTRLSAPNETPISMGIIARNPQVVEPLRELGITTYRQFFDVLLSMAAEATKEFSSLFDVDPHTLRPSKNSG